MDFIEKRDFRKSQAEANHIFFERERELKGLQEIIEQELNKDQKTSRLLSDSKREKELLDSAQQHIIQGDNAYKLKTLSTLFAASSLIVTGLEIAGGLTFPPLSLAIAGGAYLARNGFLRRGDKKYKAAQEVLAREYLGEVKLAPQSLDDYVAKLNETESQGFKLEAKPFAQDPNQVWVMANDGFLSRKIGGIYRDRTILTDLYFIGRIPKATPLEELPLKLLKLFVGSTEKEFFCPFWGVYDKEYYRAAKEVRTLALNYAEKTA